VHEQDCCLINKRQIVGTALIQRETGALNSNELNCLVKLAKHSKKESESADLSISMHRATEMLNVLDEIKCSSPTNLFDALSIIWKYGVRLAVLKYRSRDRTLANARDGMTEMFKSFLEASLNSFENALQCMQANSNGSREVSFVYGWIGDLYRYLFLLNQARLGLIQKSQASYVNALQSLFFI
jgi:hypothetical protein